MLLSSDFSMRMTGPVDGYRIPEDKSKTHEYNVDIVIKRAGKQQTFLDISRCPLLSSHFLNREIPSSCPNLLYLDLSYTHCNDLSGIYKFCTYLKALNIAGVTLLEADLRGIDALADLEALSIRESNVTDISAVASLLLLRSLDLGRTKIDKLDKGLHDKERLEEILLDGCITNLSQEFIFAMSKMKRLKVVNIHEGTFALKRAVLSRSFEFPVYYEPYARRLMFFDAVVKNDFKAVYRFISSGQDINVKAHPRDQSYFKEVFYSRCIFTKTNLRSPFFLCHEQSNPDLRPNALHLAIFFNSAESAQVLIEGNIDKAAPVYIVEVMDDPNNSEGLVEDPNPIKLAAVGMSKSINRLINSGSKKQKALESTVGEDDESSATLKKVYSPVELVKLAFDKNIHRLTEDMVNKKVTNWKSVCEQYRKRLEFIVDPSSRVETKKGCTEDDANSRDEGNSVATSMDFDEMMHRKSFSVQMEIDGGKSSVQLEEEAIARRVAQMIDLETTSSSRPTTALDVTEKQSKRNVSFAPAVDKDNKKSSNHGNDRVSAFTLLTGKERSDDSFDDFEGDGMNSDNFKAVTVVKKFHDPFHSASKHGKLDGDDTHLSNQNDDPGKVNNKKPLLLPKKHRLVEWRDHGLVYKLIGQTSVYQVPKDPTVSNNWMVSSESGLPSYSLKDIVITTDSPTSTKPSTPAIGSRPSSRAAMMGRKPSMKKTPSFGPLERLRSMSIKGLTLESDPNDAPFSHVLSTSTSRPPSAPRNQSTSLVDDDYKNEVDEKKGGVTLKDSIVAEASTRFQSSKESSIVDLEVLGKKSYWLESKGLAVQEKLKIMEEVYKKQQEIERNTIYKDGRVKRVLRKKNSMEARRKIFMEYLQNRIESKFDHLDKED